MTDHTKAMADALERLLEACYLCDAEGDLGPQVGGELMDAASEALAAYRAAQQAHPESVAHQGVASETATSRPTPSLTVGDRERFEAYFLESRRSRGASKRPTFERFPDGTYKDDHTQRHWWTWQQAIVAIREHFGIEVE